MRIFVRTLSEELITLNVDPNDTVKSLKETLKKKLNGESRDFGLIYSGKHLYQHKLLIDFNISQNSKLIMLYRYCGGGSGFPINFMFNSLEKKIKQQFSKNGPKYLTVTPGLNLLAKCKNNNCQAYGKFVWVQKGFGEYNMGKQMCMCKCPICNTLTGDATNIGYFQTQIKVLGRQADSDQIVEWSQRVTENEFTTFVNTDSQMRKWNFLQITTSPIK